jgi:hypothetical protein
MSTSIVPFDRGVTSPRIMSLEVGPNELFVLVEVQAVHVPALSVILALISRSVTVDQPELKECSVWE